MTLDERIRVYPRLALMGACWIWLGWTSKGYGYVQRSGDRKIGRVHRMVYEDLVGPIGVGLTLDHLCRNRACALPAHLEPVTNHENILRGTGPTAINASKTHCIHGHELTPENVIVRNSVRRPGRDCLTCKRRLGRKWELTHRRRGR